MMKPRQKSLLEHSVVVRLGSLLAVGVSSSQIMKQPFSPPKKLQELFCWCFFATSDVVNN